jgi:PAS domain S-box-containing protein
VSQQIASSTVREETARRSAPGADPAYSSESETEDAGGGFEGAARAADAWRETFGKPSVKALAVSMSCFVLAALLATVSVAATQILIIIGVALGLASLHLSMRVHAGRPSQEDVGGTNSLGLRLERRLEQLQDAQWRLNDNETRYRALLDAQDDMILRRDAGGALTFVNRAFLHKFAVHAEDVIGKPFTLEMCDGETAPQQLSVEDDVRQKRYTRQIRTARGPRWIAWEEQIVPAADGTSLEVQSVGRDVTEQHRFEAELAEARDAAEAANRAKSRFLAAMSHEIRTPMNGILGMASLLMETQQTPEQQTYARAVDQSARTLLALIDEILDFSKIEAGKLELSASPFALETCLQSVVELLAPRAHEKGLEMAWCVDPELPKLVIGDETRVRQILLNLLSNAVKFTDIGGVCINARAVKTDAGDGEEARVRITVEDTGIGMSREDMQKLFAEFEQAEAAVHRREGGTGLGLAISMQLARAMGGEIRVESAPGKGSTFTAELILRRAVPLAAEPHERETLAQMGRVLLAFDRPPERRALAYALDGTPLPAMESDFANAADALRAAAGRGEPFDRIVIDGVEGAPAGARLLRLARELSPHANVRGVVLVNVLARASLSEFRAAGFDSYLVRPVRPASMMMQLGVRTGGHGERDEGVVAPSAACVKPVAERPRRVLLAEDNEINALLARRVLEISGCEYAAVANGAEAIAAVRASLAGDAPPFDLILMDIFMPQVDGVAAAGEIRRLYAAADQRDAVIPPIVALTASAFAEDKKRYLEAGMDDYLAKPFDKAGLEGVLKRWFGRTAGGDTDAAA